MMTQLHPRLWRLHDERGCTGYLLVGDSKALMIDTGMGIVPVMPQIRQVTNLPVELLVTHAHYDHYSAVHEFSSMWLSRREEVMLPELEQLGGVDQCLIPRERLHWFDDDTVFDAGNLTVSVIPLSGHTPGSVVFVCPEVQALFTGDAIGSGTIVLMSVPCAYDLRAYLAELRSFVPKAQPYIDFTWHGGHARQSGTPGTEDYNPPSMTIVLDMIALIEKLLCGEIVGYEVPEGSTPGGYALRAHYGRAGIIYRADQL